MTGGSTNAVLHLLAVASEAGVELSIDDFDRIAWQTPLLADLKPFGRYVAPDLWRAGGVPLVASRLAEAGLLQPDAITVTGRTIGEEAGDAAEAEGQPVVRPLVRAAGAQRRLRDPARQPRSGRMRGEAGRPRPPRARGARARVRVRGGRLRGGQGRRDRRRRGRGHPQRGPRRAARACARCWPSPPRCRARGWATPWRCSPTAASRAPRTASWPGTWPPRRRAGARSRRCATATLITFDVEARELNVDLSAEEIAARVEAYEPPAPRYESGVLGKYARHVGSAAEGALTSYEPAATWGGPRPPALPPTPRGRGTPQAGR